MPLCLRLVLPRALCFTAASQYPFSTSLLFTNLSFVSNTYKPKRNHFADFALFSGLSSFKFFRAPISATEATVAAFQLLRISVILTSPNSCEKSHLKKLLACNFELLNNVTGGPMIYRQYCSGKNYRDVVEWSYCDIILML